MAKNQLNVNRYTRPSGEPGVGVYREYCARMQHVMIWLWSGEIERMTHDEMVRRHVRCQGDQGGTSQRPAIDQSAPEPSIDDEPGGVVPLDSPELDDQDEDHEPEPEDDPEPEEDNEPEPEPEELDEGDEATAEVPKPAQPEQTDEKPPGFVSEAQSIRDYLAEHPDAENQEVIDALAELNIEIVSSQVSRQKKRLERG